MRNLQRGFTVVDLVLCVLVFLGVGGWIANIVKMVSMAEVFTGMGIARIVGIFVAPLGAVLGYL